MNQKKLLSLVEALREAGQREHGYVLMQDGTSLLCDGDHAPGFNDNDCLCEALSHNAQVDAVAKALVAEIELEAARVEELLRGIDRVLITISGGKA